MPIPKNFLTTNRPARTIRRLYRTRIRIIAQDAIANYRSKVLQGRKSNGPDYLIVGVNKAGTTSLQEMLTSQATIGRPLLKETHYFDQHNRRPISWYRAHFWGSHELTWGEATPEYFELEYTSAAIADNFPEAKIIVCLRDPIRRAISHYYNAVDHAAERRGILDAFESEVSAIRNGHFASAPAELRNAYIQRSLYGRSLGRWRVRFRENLVVVCLEEGPSMGARVLRHLNLDGGNLPHLTRSNPRYYPEPPARVRELLMPLLSEDKPALLEATGWHNWPKLWLPV